MLSGILRKFCVGLLLLGVPGLLGFWLAPLLDGLVEQDYRLWQYLTAFLAGLGMVLAALFSQWRLSSAMVLLLSLYLLLHLNGSLPGAAWIPLQLALTVLVLAGIAILPEWGPFSPATVLTVLSLSLASLIAFYPLPDILPDFLGRTLYTLGSIDLGVTALVTLASIGMVLAAQLYRPEPSRGAILICLVCILPVTLATPLLDNMVVLAAAAVLAVWGGLLLHAWKLAFIDELTRLPNRRALDYRLRQRQAAIAMADVDHFKSFNDKWGHEAGDEVLRWVARVLSKTHDGAKAYRYGGEEFAIVFRTRHPGKAAKLLEKLRQCLYLEPFTLRGARRGRQERGKGGGKPVRITASFGLAMARPGEQPSETLRRADAALYRAKRNGRNQVVVSE